MNKALRARTIRGTLAFLTLFAVGEGCVAIYGFDEFDRQPPISCKERDDCPGDDDCSYRECVQGLCKRTNPVSEGIYPDKQPVGDCKRIKCDGKGGEITEVDLTDLPFDANECTEDVCTDGVAKNNAIPQKECGATIPPLRCNDEGFCAGCTTASDCGLPNNPCATFACEMGICSRTPRNVGAIASNTVAGDCQAYVCNATGDAVEQFEPSDAIPDADPCTVETCKEDGTFVSSNAPDGTKCGDCMVCVAGMCGGCDGSISDCYQGECIPKPQNCKENKDCGTGYCVDDFCCDSECTTPCFACNNMKTGVPSGYCAPVTNGTDPDDDCIDKADDVCWEGACRCHNGKRDGDETGLDCGGTGCDICTGTWDCGGDAACNGAGTSKICCEPFCYLCADQTADCLGLDGETCTIGTPDKTLSLGAGPDPNCFANANSCPFVSCTCR